MVDRASITVTEYHWQRQTFSWPFYGICVDTRLLVDRLDFASAAFAWDEEDNCQNQR
jgi:hypothetical protein